MKNLDNKHYKVMNLILKYLKGVINKKIYLKGDGTGLQSYVDLDLMGYMDGKRITMGYIFPLRSIIVNQNFRLHKIVAFSTTKVQYVAMKEASKEIIQI